jgi:hypothetical protein
VAILKEVACLVIEYGIGKITEIVVGTFVKPPVAV